MFTSQRKPVRLADLWDQTKLSDKVAEKFDAAQKALSSEHQHNEDQELKDGRDGTASTGR